jgi:hypothetical protein
MSDINEFCPHRLRKLSDKKLYRFTSQRWVEQDPDRFFLNFLDSDRTFNSAGRLAAPKVSPGFYFSPRVHVAMAEVTHYLGIKRLGSSNPIDLLKACTQDPLVLLEVVVDRLSVLDLTAAENIFWLIKKHGIFSWSRQPDAIDCYLTFVDSPNGGGESSAVYGMFAKKDGFRGVAFPSRRALECDDRALWTTANNQFGARWVGDEIFEIPHGDDAGVTDVAIQQLQLESNVVVFSGSDLARSIKRYSILRSDGTRIEHVNPYFGVHASEVENSRLAEASRLGLSAEDALRAGLVPDAMLNDYYADQHWWVKNVDDEC